MDKLYIKDLEVFANHGVFEEEKRLGQKFLISITLELDLYKAAITGDLTQSVHYGELCAEIEQEFQKESYDLIETAGEKLAAYILSHYTMVKGLSVLIKKPWAPIGKPIDHVSIEINHSWHRAFIAFGSNLGNKAQNIETAIQTLKKREDIRLIQQSTIIETEPWGYANQDTFLNGVMEIETTLGPSYLMDLLLDTEKILKRERNIHWGPRTLDLDILFYDNLILDNPHITLPHPRISDRLFVLEPMVEIAPFYTHPVFRKSMIALLDILKKAKTQ